MVSENPKAWDEIFVSEDLGTRKHMSNYVSKWIDETHYLRFHPRRIRLPFRILFGVLLMSVVGDVE